MSAGDFVSVKYEMDNDMVTLVTLQPETVAAAVGTDTNVEPTADVTLGIPSAKVSLGVNEIGIKPRRATGKWVTVAANTEYTIGDPVSIVLLTKAAITTLGKGKTVEYNGGTVLINKVRPEIVN